MCLSMHKKQKTYLISQKKQHCPVITAFDHLFALDKLQIGLIVTQN
jgi:hypothetical protein